MAKKRGLTEYLVPEHCTWECEGTFTQQHQDIVDKYLSECKRRRDKVKIEIDYKSNEHFESEAGKLTNHCTNRDIRRSPKDRVTDHAAGELLIPEPHQNRVTTFSADTPSISKSVRESSGMKIIRQCHFIVHMSKDSSEISYSCSQCSYTSLKKDNVIVHLRSHTGEKPFLCKICGKSFSSKYYWKRHINAHTAEKIYDCPHCESRFADPIVRKKHLLTHATDKSFKCEQCKKSFKLKNYLNKHMLTHSVDRPYKCDSCEKSYARKHHLQRHKLSHTSGQPIDETQTVTSM